MFFLDDGSADLWEVLSEQASLRVSMETVLWLRFLPGHLTLQDTKDAVRH